MTPDSTIRDHQAWLGYLQPDGLVVSPQALVDAQAILERNTLPLQERFLPFAREVEQGEEVVQAIADLPSFVRGFLEWPDDCIYGLDPARPVPDVLTLPLPEFGETLQPDFVFRDPRSKDAAKSWLLLVKSLPLGTDLDARQTDDPKGWSASPSQRFERLLSETRVPIGLLTNGVSLRLIYKPHGENTGTLTFPVAAMTEVAGRPILAAFHLLLDRYRLLAAPTEARLPALLARSREYQSSVSTELADQVLDALYELLRGFQAADERAKGDLLRAALARNPADVYGGLLTVLMRLVFLLYAEDRGLMPGSALYVRNYSVHSLFERLRADNERYPDTMDLRYGAWAQLLALFRAVHAGCKHAQFAMPARQGYLFDPARFPFLEGSSQHSSTPALHPSVPLIPDGTLYRVLSKLMLLDGERLSYRTLDVEQIGSVYEAIMGFRLKVAAGQTIAIKPGKARGAPAAINLEALLEVKPADRLKWLADRTDQKLAGEIAEGVKAAGSIDDLLAALDRKIARNATPHVVPRGAMVLQPSDERRRSGSHYTPRKLTEPIVRKTLAKILERLGPHPTPEVLLDLKVCDPAVGSGAFLVEVCRQLAEALVRAWHHHGKLPRIPPDEDELLYARRVVAQRCVYGVDRNPMAVDLAKLSLWLATLAKDHPFTFLDHAIRAGDSLVGLTRRQIEQFHWAEQSQLALGQDYVAKRLELATRARQKILEAGEEISPLYKRERLAEADESLDLVRFAGDLVIAAFFGADKDKARQALRDQYLGHLADYLKTGDITKRPTAAVAALRSGEFPVTPFHWEIEYPEVFRRDNPGFDAFVGNPPFAGHVTVAEGNAPAFTEYLRATFPETGGKCDVVAFFFRRAFDYLREQGSLGLIATKTIGQGDTRESGLRWICTRGGTIYAAQKRYKWPGQAAVIVSVVWLTRGAASGPFDLDGRDVSLITAYLFHAGGNESPCRFRSNAGKSFQGSVIRSMGFTFDDTDTKGIASSLSEMRDIVDEDPRNADLIFPYIGGEEVNNSPTISHHRYVINFGEMGETEARRWPRLFQIAENRVLPDRKRSEAKSTSGRILEKYWQYGHTAKSLYDAIRGFKQVLAVNCGATPHMAFCFLPGNMVFANTLDVFPFDNKAAFSLLQSQVHESWARFFSSSMKDDLRYTPSDCFETFPFPAGWETSAVLEAAGQAYYEYRAALMVKNNEGLTKTYNRFHDPDERSPEILKLRDLHAAMDRAVLDAYGWTDLPTDCEFLLDYEDDAEEADTTGLGEAKPRKRKKPWRYRWPDPIRDEVLARLLDLNAQRAEEESLAAAVSVQEASRVIAKRKRASSATSESQGNLF